MSETHSSAFERELAAWKRADVAYRVAGERAEMAARELLKVGRVVKWVHGQYFRLGEIVDVSGQYHFLRVRVRAVSGRTYWVQAADVLKELTP